MTRKPCFAQILLGIPLKEPLTYAVPRHMNGKLCVGSRAWVPFRNLRKVGYCVGLSAKSAFPKVRPVAALIDDEPILEPAMLKLTRWMSETYGASWGECIETALPGAVRHGRTQMRIRKVSSQSTPAPDTPRSLSVEQDQAFSRIREAIRKNKYGTFLLHGVTASGKTEVYLQALAQAMSQGKSGLVLVPEIALAPQTVDRFRARFGETVAVYHSRLSVGERFRVWQGVRSRSISVVVGTRSALFLPIQKLGLIVLDEEHEPAYKQEEVPRYHAREVAIERARIEGAVAILGSATPSLESLYRARRNIYSLMTLPKRLERRSLPKATVIDMRHQGRPGRRSPVFSVPLVEAITECIRAGEGILLFLNRRGFSSFVNCRRCGYVMRCKNCEVSLVYHAGTKRLQCHYCGHEQETVELCPSCDKGYLSFFGVGTEKVESELARLFPKSRVIRMDRDTTSRKGAHREIYEAFKSGQIHVLVGTQMIAKGLHFPHVTLVGILSADTLLNIPDFRAGERTFQLLTQVAGRGGRGDVPGRVIIQTFNPEHPVVRAAAQHAYGRFSRYELSHRKELVYPPYARLVNVVFRGKQEERVARAAKDFADVLKRKLRKEAVRLVGPAPMPIVRIRGFTRWHILIKSKRQGVWLKDLGKWVRAAGRKGVRAVLDVDPVSML